MNVFNFKSEFLRFSNLLEAFRLGYTLTMYYLVCDEIVVVQLKQGTKVYQVEDLTLFKAIVALDKKFGLRDATCKEYDGPSGFTSDDLADITATLFLRETRLTMRGGKFLVCFADDKFEPSITERFEAFTAIKEFFHKEKKEYIDA